MSFSPNNNLSIYALQYGDTDISGESDTDEPNQRSVDKYLCSRRHTVGPGDTHHEEVLRYRKIIYLYTFMPTCIYIQKTSDYPN